MDNANTPLLKIEDMDFMINEELADDAKHEANGKKNARNNKENTEDGDAEIIWGTTAQDEHINTSSPAAITTAAPPPDLADLMRRLSVDSDLSSYSVASSVPSVRSLDSNGSVSGGVTVDFDTVQDLEGVNGTLALAGFPGISGALNHPNQASSLSTQSRDARCASTKPLLHDDTMSIPTFAVDAGMQALKRAHPDLSPGGASSVNNPTASNSSSRQTHTLTSFGGSSSGVSDFWLQFPKFDPNPTASFKSELKRLVKQQGWNAKTQRKRKFEALTAEFDLHYGTCMTSLDRWQQLCKDVNITNVPTSITQCKKALRPILINLYNLVDFKRNPDFKLRGFSSYADFVKYTRKGRTFPRECAKQDGFIKVLLKKI